MLSRGLYTLVALLVISSFVNQSHAFDFRILYRWFPGPGNCDTLRLYVESTTVNPVPIEAANFSIAYRDSCDTLKSFDNIFSTQWGTFFEGSFPDLRADKWDYIYRCTLKTETTPGDSVCMDSVISDSVLLFPGPIYGGNAYNRKIQYGNFSFTGIIAPPVGNNGLLFATAVFCRSCPSLPYVENETENRANQWQGPFGTGYTYEVIPIIILPFSHVDIQAEWNASGNVDIQWEFEDVSSISSHRLYRVGEESPIFTSGDPEPRNMFVDEDHQHAAIYYVEATMFDGQTIQSDRVEVQRATPDDNLAQVYPQPAQDMLHVVWPVDPGMGVLVLRDLLGKEITSFSKQPGVADITCKVSSLPEGSYVLQWRGAQSFTRKIVIRH